jgi:PAS domain S-box-containing protein
MNEPACRTRNGPDARQSMVNGNPTLLVVDRDPGVLSVITQQALPLGYAVECRDPDEPIHALITAVGPDVAMLEVPSPSVAGLQTLRIIRKTDPSCRVILMSAFDTAEAALDAIRNGASDYLAKPLSGTRVRRALTAVSTMAGGHAHEKQTALEPPTDAPQNTARREKLIADAMIDNLPALEYVADEHGHFLRWNHSLLTATGYTGDEIHGMSPLDFIAADDPPLAHAHMAEVFKTGHASLEASLLSKDGRLTPYLFIGRRVELDGARYVVGIGVDITSRKQLAERLSESERRYRDLLRETDRIIVRWNARGVITFINEFGQRFFGYTEAELVGQPVIGTLVPPTSRSGRDPNQLMALLRVDLSAFDRNMHDHVRRNGERVSVSWAHRIVVDADGRVQEVLSVGTDVTEQRRAELALRASEGRYRALFECAPDGIVIARRGGGFVDANASACRMLGYPPDELIGLRAPDILADANAADLEWEQRRISAVSPYYRAWRCRRKDGSLFPAEVIVTELPDGNLLGMIRDVSEREAALDALRTAEERMRFALVNAEVGIWDIDLMTGEMQWSDLLERQFGLQPGSFGGTLEAFLERVHPDDRPSVRDTIAKAKERGGDFSLLNRTIRPDGTVRWLSGTGRVLLGEHGQPVRGVGISQDVTDRRALEEQYLQAQRMEAIGRLAGGVAHDFNTLLTVILGFCELLLSDLDAADPRHADIEEIQKAGLRGSNLTRQLLAFSRKQVIEPALLDLNAVLAEMRGMLSRLIGERVNVVVRADPALSLVHADRGQMEQVIMNLAVNAKDAMPDGGTLTIDTADVELDEQHAATPVVPKPGSYVALTVSDTGTGMTPEVRARIFEPFFTTKDVGKGTGLGLATIHGIVARNAGSVSVQSELGHGSSFTVYLPKCAAVERAPSGAGPVTHARAGGEMVLVVDDAEELRELTARLLEMQGYRVLLASNAGEALRLCEQNRSIDVVLTDIVMPGASGSELTRKLSMRWPGLKVIYMSGYADEIVDDEILKAGIAFLHKPFSSDTLGRKLREVLERPS